MHTTPHAHAHVDIFILLCKCIRHNACMFDVTQWKLSELNPKYGVYIRNISCHCYRRHNIRIIPPNSPYIIKMIIFA